MKKFLSAFFIVLISSGSVFAYADFGYATATGDFDGDGIDELAVGAPGMGSWNFGAVYMYEGGVDSLEYLDLISKDY